MELKLIKTMWGILDSSKEEDRLPSTWDRLFMQLREEGYSGIEACMGPFNPFEGQAKELQTLLQRHGLVLVAQIHTCGYPISSRAVEDHVRSFQDRLREARDYGAVLVNSHTGCDAWALPDALRCLRACAAAEAEAALPVAHETHRQRILFNPWVTRDALLAIPELRVTADLSHFVVVCERVLDDRLDPDWPGILALVAARCRHTHARVGYAQGPQVPDPASAEYAAELAAHERWWRALWAAAAARGDAAVTVTPEHGPPPYLHTLCGTGAPAADLAAANRFIAGRARAILAEVAAEG